MLYQELQRLDAKGTPIRVSVSGAGWLGSGFVKQIARVPGMIVNIVADADVQAAVLALKATGLTRDQIVEASAVGLPQPSPRLAPSGTLSSSSSQYPIFLLMVRAESTLLQHELLVLQHESDVQQLGLPCLATVAYPSLTAFLISVSFILHALRFYFVVGLPA